MFARWRKKKKNMIYRGIGVYVLKIDSAICNCFLHVNEKITAAKIIIIINREEEEKNECVCVCDSPEKNMEPARNKIKYLSHKAKP